MIDSVVGEWWLFYSRCYEMDDCWASSCDGVDGCCAVIFGVGCLLEYKLRGRGIFDL